MNLGLIGAVLLAWPIVVTILFRAIEPRRAVLVGVLGGFLFLPPGTIVLDGLGFPFKLDKWTSTGIALICGVSIFDRRALLEARPGWLDLPMLAY